MFDHADRPRRSFQLADEPGPDPARVDRWLECPGLVSVAADGIERSRQIVADRCRVDLAPTKGVDAVADLAERRFDALAEVADLAPKAFDIAGSGKQPAGPAEDHRKRRREGQECEIGRASCRERV